MLPRHNIACCSTHCNELQGHRHHGNRMELRSLPFGHGRPLRDPSDRSLRVWSPWGRLASLPRDAVTHDHLDGAVLQDFNHFLRPAPT
ncbi:hypothetical protein SKAU_G00078550 [Synaphobranchus kaupii]|uniref:Uncharacterized protein n=1 Tax=Synaphobranchus kaupii TaxID=118154 RepID=A0A9Q1FUI3_SYNKA|nr:hypothetical protein SKAU_G00078550 [Synaphobranchus kaupii]